MVMWAMRGRCWWCRILVGDQYLIPDVLTSEQQIEGSHCVGDAREEVEVVVVDLAG